MVDWLCSEVHCTLRDRNGLPTHLNNTGASTWKYIYLDFTSNSERKNVEYRMDTVRL